MLQHNLSGPTIVLEHFECLTRFLVTYNVFRDALLLLS